jgi:uncharacterized membrane protein YfcA
VGLAELTPTNRASWPGGGVRVQPAGGTMVNRPAGSAYLCAGSGRASTVGGADREQPVSARATAARQGTTRRSRIPSIMGFPPVHGDQKATACRRTATRSYRPNGCAGCTTGAAEDLSTCGTVRHVTACGPGRGGGGRDSVRAVIDASPGSLVFLLVAGLLAGGVNAVAGGGSLLVFPALLAVGFPPLAANVTNSVAQWPGYVGIVVGVRKDLQGQRRRILLTSAVAVVGSALGCVLLLILPGAVFDAVVPALVLLASALLGFQPWIKRWIGAPEPGAPDRLRALLPAVFLAAVYGGYFGGALGVILIATLSLCAHDRLVRLNALKGLLSLVIATVTVVIFAFEAPVDWLAVALLAPTTLVGGFLGAQVAQRLPENVLRWAVVVVGAAVGIYLIVT